MSEKNIVKNVHFFNYCLGQQRKEKLATIGYRNMNSSNNGSDVRYL